MGLDVQGAGASLLEEAVWRLEAARFEVEFNIKLKRDGTLETMPVALSSASTPYQRVFMESGLRAIIECAPYRLPPGFFAEWQAFIPVFDNRDL